MQLASGHRLGRYAIRSKLGEGGMGEVYLADDTDLGRPVAIKILPDDLASRSDRMSRFTQEAKAAAALNHPNIAHIYEIGESEGLHFIAMEFVDGETLTKIAKSGRLDLTTSLRTLQHVAEALAKAHAAGIIHRDLKPDNIMLTRDGHAKILDFGLAKLTPQGNSATSDAQTAILGHQSTPGTVLGTAGYMSPEQARGAVDGIDHRSDIFSFGCILYECLAGRRAFDGSDAIDTLNKIIREAPTPLAEIDPNIPTDLQKVVRRCLAKDPDERFQSIKDVAIELRDVRRELTHDADTTIPPMSFPSQSAFSTQGSLASTTSSPAAATAVSSAEYIASGIGRHKLAAGLGSFAVLAVGVVLVWFFAFRSTSALQIESIAVMPFANTGGNPDLEYLSDGMTESLINNLSQLSRLSVKARSSVFRYKDKEIDPKQVASDLKVQALLNGRIAQRGEMLTISLELVDALTGNQIWGDQYTRKMGDLASLQTEIARDVSQKLRTRLTGEEERRVVKNQTQNTEAYQLYLQGKYYWNKRTDPATKKAVELFQQAIDKDPTYAMAYVGLAESYVTGDVGLPYSESMRRQKAAGLKALEIDPSLGEAHTVLGNHAQAEHNFVLAESEFKKAIELSPNYATAYHWYGEFLIFQGRVDEGFAQYKRALELDPFSLAIGTDYGLGYFWAHRYDEAAAYLNKIIETDPSYVRTYDYLSQVYDAMGRHEDSVDVFAKSLALKGVPPQEIAEGKKALLDAIHSGGSKAYWLKSIELSKIFAQKQGREPFTANLATQYAYARDYDKAFEYLNRTVETQEDPLLPIKVAPEWEPVRNDPRFIQIMRRLNYQ